MTALHPTSSAGRAGRHESITRELNEERAAALFRISRTLENLITELQRGQEAVRDLAPADRARAVSAYRETRRRALQYRWFLEVQREAIGLRQHRHLDEFYRIPPDIE